MIEIISLVEKIIMLAMGFFLGFASGLSLMALGYATWGEALPNRMVIAIILLIGAITTIYYFRGDKIEEVKR